MKTPKEAINSKKNNHFYLHMYVCMYKLFEHKYLHVKEEQDEKEEAFVILV